MLAQEQFHGLSLSLVEGEVEIFGQISDGGVVIDPSILARSFGDMFHAIVEGSFKTSNTLRAHTLSRHPCGKDERQSGKSVPLAGKIVNVPEFPRYTPKSARRTTRTASADYLRVLFAYRL